MWMLALHTHTSFISSSCNYAPMDAIPCKTPLKPLKNQSPSCSESFFLTRAVHIQKVVESIT